jgi:sugar/nucleoside kinase (ribokinase family)
MFCSWGAIGSFGKEVGAKENETSIYFAGTPDVIPVDSVGAGDTWIASLISYLSENVEWREALRKSTWIASQKVAIKGFDLFSILSTQQFFDQAGL